MNRRSHKFIISGLLLLGVSAYPLALMAREWSAARRFMSRHAIHPVYDRTSVEFHGHRIELSDPFLRGTYGPEDRRIGKVAVNIDGKDYSDQSLVEIRPYEKGPGKYHGWATLAYLKNKKTAQEWMTIGQRTLGDTLTSGRRQPTPEFRILRVDEKGEVAEERFDLAQRADPLYRTIYVRFLYPHPVGFYADTIRYPTVLSPVIYPCVSGAIGLLLLVGGFAGRLLGA